MDGEIAMFDLQTFHDQWIIKNTTNDTELKLQKVDIPKQFVCDLMNFLKEIDDIEEIRAEYNRLSTDYREQEQQLSKLQLNSAELKLILKRVYDKL